MSFILLFRVNAFDDKITCILGKDITLFYLQHASTSKQQNQFWLLASIVCCLILFLIYFFILALEVLDPESILVL